MPSLRMLSCRSIMVTMFALSTACAFSESPAPGEFTPERSRMVVVPVDEPAAEDAYDDLGDFVATYDLKLADKLGTSEQYFHYGRLQVSRRGSWVCFTDSVQQPMAAGDGRIDAPWLTNAWIFNDGVCEGHFENGGMTVDPNALFSPAAHVVDPIHMALGWVVWYDESAERYKIARSGEADSLLRARMTQDVQEPARGGMPSVSCESMERQPVSDWGEAAQFRRIVRPDGNPRSTAAVMLGIRVRANDGAVIEVPVSTREVSRWSGKLPGEISIVRYSPPVWADAASPAEARQRIEAAADTANLDARRTAEISLTLLNVRSATEQDRISMADWESATSSLCFNDPTGEPQDVRSRDASDQVAVLWRVNPVSLRWEQAP